MCLYIYIYKHAVMWVLISMSQDILINAVSMIDISLFYLILIYIILFCSSHPYPIYENFNLSAF